MKISKTHIKNHLDSKLNLDEIEKIIEYIELSFSNPYVLSRSIYNETGDDLIKLNRKFYTLVVSKTLYVDFLNKIYKEFSSLSHTKIKNIVIYWETYYFHVRTTKENKEEIEFLESLPIYSLRHTLHQRYNGIVTIDNNEYLVSNLKSVLANKPHIQNKLESKLVRQERAKFNKQKEKRNKC